MGFFNPNGLGNGNLQAHTPSPTGVPKVTAAPTTGSPTNSTPSDSATAAPSFPTQPPYSSAPTMSPRVTQFYWDEDNTEAQSDATYGCACQKSRAAIDTEKGLA